MLENTYNDLRFLGTTQENMGGARTFRFAPVSWITTLPPAIQGVVIGEATFTDGEQWINVIPIEDSAGMDEDEERGKGGPVYDNSAQCEITGDTTHKRMQVDSMLRIPVIAEWTDNNGMVRRMGELGDPAFFTAKRGTGRGTSARTAWTLLLEWRSERPMPVVDPDFIPTPAPEEEEAASDSIGEASGELGPG